MEQTSSSATFSEEPSQLDITTLIERVPVLELKLKNLEPSLSSLHSSISSGPLEPPEGVKKEEGQGAESTSAVQEQTLQRRIENLETWVRSYTGGISINALGFSLKEMEARLMRRIESLESQLAQLTIPEFPSGQRELESRADKLSQHDDLPSFGMSTSAPTSSLEARMKAMEINHELATENARLTTRIQQVED